MTSVRERSAAGLSPIATPHGSVTCLTRLVRPGRPEQAARWLKQMAGGCALSWPNSGRPPYDATTTPACLRETGSEEIPESVLTTKRLRTRASIRRSGWSLSVIRRLLDGGPARIRNRGGYESPVTVTSGIAHEPAGHRADLTAAGLRSVLREIAQSKRNPAQPQTAVKPEPSLPSGTGSEPEPPTAPGVRCATPSPRPARTRRPDLRSSRHR
jgi:hypothetical protein